MHRLGVGNMASMMTVVLNEEFQQIEERLTDADVMPSFKPDYVTTQYGIDGVEWDTQRGRLRIRPGSGSTAPRRFLVRAQITIAPSVSWKLNEGIDFYIDTIYNGKLVGADNHTKVEIRFDYLRASGYAGQEYNSSAFANSRTATLFSIQQVRGSDYGIIPYIQVSMDPFNCHSLFDKKILGYSNHESGIRGFSYITFIELARASVEELPEVVLVRDILAEQRAAVAISPPQVRNVIIGTVLTDEQIEGCISTATIIVLDHLIGTPLSVNTLTEITLYLSSHFVSLRDRTTRIRKERIGDAEVEYEASKSPANYLALSSTEWGATALTLDTTGILASLGTDQPRLISL